MTPPVFTLENFVPESVCREISRHFDNHGKRQLQTIQEHTSLMAPLFENHCIPEYKASTGETVKNIGQLSAMVRRELFAMYPITDPLKTDYVVFSRMYPGGFHKLHADATTLEGKDNHCPWRVATAMLYLGEWWTDFTGGELIFPVMGTRIKAKPGMLVGFLCGLDHQHEVPEVESGVRDSIAFWFRTDKKSG